MGHGIAVDPLLEDGGTTAPFLLKTTISAAINIIKFWEIDNTNNK